MNVTVAVTAHAERADITTSSGDQNATTALTFAARAEIVAGATGTEIMAISNSSEYEGVKYQFVDGGVPAGTGTVAYNSISKTLTYTANAAAATMTNLVAAINADATVSKLFAAQGGDGTLANTVLIFHLASNHDEHHRLEQRHRLQRREGEPHRQLRR